MNITAQSVRVETGSADEEGCLILAERNLVAVVVRLSGDHGANGGRWFLEAGFGPLGGLAHPEFDDVDSALDWVAQRLLRSKRIGFKTDQLSISRMHDAPAEHAGGHLFAEQSRWAHLRHPGDAPPRWRAGEDR